VAQPFSALCGAGVISAEPCPRELGREIPAPRRRIVLAACVLAPSMAFIDSSVLTAALPSLRAAFGADFGTVQWVGVGSGFARQGWPLARAGASDSGR
jgi:hypothetical protein